MPLINCPECNKQVSNLAEICIGCGAPVFKLWLIGKPFEILMENKVSDEFFHSSNILQVAENDFPYFMNLQQAIEACQKLGEGWRLPYYNEWQLICQNEYYLKGFTEISNYWMEDSSIKLPQKNIFRFGNKQASLKLNILDSDACKVRPVRILNI